MLFGVPQGSVLGPTLFNIYASSLSLVIQNLGFNTSGYADDNNAYESFALTFQYHIITKKLPDLLNLINEWMNLYFLKMNPDKTEIIMFVPPNLKDTPTIQGCVFTTYILLVRVLLLLQRSSSGASRCRTAHHL